MGITAAVGGAAVAGVAGSAISSGAAQSAAGSQEAAANQATATQLQMFNQVQKNLQPYMNLGAASGGTLGYLLGLPGYGNVSGGAPAPAPAPAPTPVNTPSTGSSIAGPLQTGNNELLQTAINTLNQNSPNSYGTIPLGNGYSLAGYPMMTEGDVGDRTSPTQTPPRYNYNLVSDSTGKTVAMGLQGVQTFLGNLPAGASGAGAAAGGTAGAGAATGAGGTGAGAGAGGGTVIGMPATGLAGGLGYGALTTPFQPTMASLEATPGYQFALNQGLLGVQNSAAAQGLGSSGTALTGAANYATGLASTTFQQQFENYLAQNQQIYNMLTGTTGIGENAAGGFGNTATQTGANIGSNIIGAGNAAAAGTIGSANALTSGLGSISGNALSGVLLNNLFSGSGGGGGTASAVGGGFGF